MRSTWALALLTFACTAFAGQAEIDAHNRNAQLATDASQIDRIVVATAQSRLMGDPKFQEKVDYFMYHLRPPALWDPSSPAWAPARAALISVARPETLRQIANYWKDLHPLLTREVAGSFQPGEAAAFAEFAQTPGAKAYFEKRLADLRAVNGEMLYDLDPAPAAELAKKAKEARARFDALPAAEKKSVESFLAGSKCGPCYRPAGIVMERYITDQATWLAGVLTLEFQSTDYHAVDGWVATLNEQLRGKLPVDSKKQLLGTLEMRKDALLAFTFKFYWHDRPDGGAITLEFPRGHPNYAEVLALVPGIATGQSRVLYRDKDGVINDQP